MSEWLGNISYIHIHPHTHSLSFYLIHFAQHLDSDGYVLLVRLCNQCLGVLKAHGGMKMNCECVLCVCVEKLKFQCMYVCVFA